jgi:hypothetical protein
MMRNETADIYFAVSSGKGGPVWPFVFGCLDATHRFEGRGGCPGIMPFVQTGLYVPENRDILTARFLASGCRHLLMIDTDIGFTADDVQALLDCGREVVSGTYHYQDGSDVVVGTGTGEMDGQLERCMVVPAGFLLVTRAAVLTLMATMPEDIYAVPGVGVVPAVWTERYKPGAPFVRDDAAFSKHCVDAGITLWRHTGVVLSHHGSAVY